MCWEMETRTFPTAASALSSSQSFAHSNPQDGEEANTLALCRALGNNSADVPICFLNPRPFTFFSFLRTQLFSISQRRHQAQTGLCQHRHTSAPGDHQGICADNSIYFANNTLSDILGSAEPGALQGIPEGP